MRIVCTALLLSLFGASALATEDAAWAALRQGGHVALVRHAAAPGGAGDPPNFRLEDCATQRNLSPQGREDARRLGERLRREQVTVGKVLSSRWCRCRETAALMNVGPVTEAATFDNAFVLRERVPELTAGAREIVAGWSGPGTLLVVTHGANIGALMGVNPGEAEMVVLAPDAAAAAKFRVIGRIALKR